MDNISMWSKRITSFIFGTALGTRTMHSNEEDEGETEGVGGAPEKAATGKEMK